MITQKILCVLCVPSHLIHVYIYINGENERFEKN